jgi:hypothetical protein
MQGTLSAGLHFSVSSESTEDVDHVRPGDRVDFIPREPLMA